MEQPPGLGPDLADVAIGNAVLTSPPRGSRCRDTPEFPRAGSDASPGRPGRPPARRRCRLDQEPADSRSSRRWSGRSGMTQPLGDPGLGMGVHRARRFHQDQDLGVADEGAGQRDPLSLSSGEGPSALLDHAVQPIRKRVQHVGRRCRVDGLVEVLSSCRRYGSRPARSVPLNSRGSVSLTTMRRRTSASGRSTRGTRRV